MSHDFAGTIRLCPSARRAKVSVALALAAMSLVAMTGLQVAGHEVAGASPSSTEGTGFSSPFSGAVQYLHLAPTGVANAAQLNRPMGQAAADRLAKKLGLSKSDVFTQQQFEAFITGQGVGGDPSQAALVDASVRILTNTIGHPLTSDVGGVPTESVLASYGVFVNAGGLLESPANLDAPTRQVNSVIAPGGYLGKWCRANGATQALVTLYKSAYTVEALYGFDAQKISGPAQLVTNTKQKHEPLELGMSMAPALWIVNFTLIYTLNPVLAAAMPAYWAPIPSNVAAALLGSPSGQIPYGPYASAFK